MRAPRAFQRAGVRAPPPPKRLSATRSHVLTLALSHSRTLALSHLKTMHPRAEELIRILRLQPHPEGGFYSEEFRSPHAVDPRDGRPERSALTVIHFLLVDRGHSRWHRVSSDEGWIWIEGDALELFRLEGDRAIREVLGPASDGARPIGIVPSGQWQAARTTGAYTLVSCPVGPGFDFADFQMLSDLPADADRVRRDHPDLADLI